MVYTSRLDGKTVTIDIDGITKCGIMLSGGLDSAVLLAMLIDSGITDIQPFTIDKVDGSYYHATNIIDHFNTKFRLNIPATILVGDPTAHHSRQGATAVVDIIANHRIDALFNALNQNPPELTDHPSAPNRTTKSPNKTIRLPFVELYKSHIVDFMLQLGHNDLMDVTHTCTEQTQGRCGVCWQCQERQWAFSKLNKIDTGIQ